MDAESHPFQLLLQVAESERRRHRQATNQSTGCSPELHEPDYDIEDYVHDEDKDNSDIGTPPGQTTTDLGPTEVVNDKYGASEHNQQGGASVQPSLADALVMLADVITKKGDGLPKKEPVKFHGDIFEFPVWLNSFKVLVEDRYPDAADRLYYLGRYTAGEAKEAIKGLLLLNSRDAYARAKAILQDRFGNKVRLAQNFREKLAKWPQVKNGKSLREFADFLNQCEGAMSTLGQLSVLNDALEQNTILEKLPRNVQIRWIKIVDSWQYGDPGDQREEPSEEHPPFARLCEFIEKEARILCNPLLDRQSPNTGTNFSNQNAKPKRGTQSVPKEPGVRSVSAFAINSAAPVRPTDPQGEVPPSFGTGSGSSSGSTRAPVVKECVVCQQAHLLESCAVFKGKSLAERLELVKGKGLCLGCFKQGHKKFRCQNKMKCEVCQLTHPTLLHDYSRQSAAASTTPRTADQNAVVRCTQTRDSNNCTNSLIVPVSIHHRDNPFATTVVYALLDNQANACLVLDSVLDKLDVHGDTVKVKMTTALGEDMVTCQKIDGLVVRGLRESSEVNLPATLSRAGLPVDPSQIPRPETARKWKHLEKVAEQLTPYLDSVEVGIIIGNNCTQAIRPLEVVPGDETGPYGIRTTLGWGVVGQVGDSGDHSTPGHFVYTTSAKEVSPSQVLEMFQLEFNEREADNPDAKLSVNDKKFLQLMDDGLHVRDDGHFELPLPIPDDVRMPNNRPMVEKRLRQLKGRLLKNQQYKDDYKTFMDGLLEHGFAERVPAEELDKNDGRIWYIPHHGVYHPHKPGKIRIVFDCSAEYNSEVLNKRLLPGPDMTNNLTGVLCRFRKGLIAFSCDIEGMFHQVGVNREHRNFLRFLWWENGCLENPPCEYRMTVHPFGATSSPACVNFALKAAANELEGEYGQEAADYVRDDFYADDGPKSLDSVAETIDLVKNATALCQARGFRLHKVVSSEKSVLEAVPESERGKNVQSLDLRYDDLPMERTLGMEWHVQSDNFQFSISLKDKPLTRRGILSTVSSIFDPLGLVAPVLLKGRLILQELCLQKADWDDPLSEDICMKWERWRLDLIKLAQAKIPRCYKSRELGPVIHTELHCFSDASETGYGQCSYLKQVDDKGRVETALVMSKSRVPPPKAMTIPRLELTAAVTAVKVGSFLERQLKIPGMESLYHTDSMVVLGYISNDTKRFHVFVANRVQQIKDVTSPDQWQHVSTESNPADIASRGANAEDLINSNLWWKGPESLHSSGNPAPSMTEKPIPLADNDPEVKRSIAVYQATVNPATNFASMSERFAYFSDWFRLKRSVALCLRYFKLLKNRSKVEGYIPVTVQEMQAAQDRILMITQEQAFPREIQSLKTEINHVGKDSSLVPLDPFLDAKSILRVGGRLKHAKMSSSVRQPILLPRHSHVSNLVIDWHHRLEGHAGRGITLNSSRQAGFWIIGGRAAVTTHIMKCVTCRRLRGNPCGQKMADLPEDRIEPAAPFTYSGADYFGPFIVKSGRSDKKRWVALFTCMSSRAIHLEVSHSMNTDSFINAYRRFACRRGPIRKLRCDRGTNFIGGRNEIASSLAEMDQDKICRELLKDNCDFVKFDMNVPSASHMGGSWERMIGCARNVLSGILEKHGNRLDDELLHTLLVEVELIVNSRPLTFVDTKSPDSLEPLCPNQLLTLKSKAVMPLPGTFVEKDLYCRKRWRAVQYLANQFWTTWRREFLPTLQLRKKWLKPQRNLAENDVVCLIDESLPRCSWPLARILEAREGSDGLVRTVKLRARGSDLERPIHKVIALVTRDVPAKEPNPA